MGSSCRRKARQLSPTKLGEQGLRREDTHPAMSGERKQVPSVAGCEDIHLRFDGAGENEVIGGIAGDGVGCGRRRGNQIGGQIREELLDLAPAVSVETQLAGEDSLQLRHDRLGKHEFEAAVYRLFDDTARGTGRDEGGDEDVGVAEDAQVQPCAERISSTSVSLSSGPIPRASARSRP
jgi:hypothetical protein